jgi:two-component system, NtrC family, C4-dicarboxylate transport sensor histidine kinase DctB
MQVTTASRKTEEASSHPLHQGRLSWIVAACIVVLSLLATAFAAQQLRERAIQTQADQLRRTAEVYALGLRAAAAAHRDLPFTVAQHPDVQAILQASHSPIGRERVNRYLQAINENAQSDALYVMDSQGLTLAASNWNQPRTFVGQSYANRPYFQDAMHGKQGLFYGVGQTTAIPGLFISSPVRVQDQIIGVVAVKISLRDMQASWAKLRDPVALADAYGIIFLASLPEWLYKSKQALSSQVQAELLRGRQYANEQPLPALPWQSSDSREQGSYELRTSVLQQSKHYLAVDEDLPELNWTLTVMADYAVINQAYATTWLIGSLLSGLMLLASMAWRLRQRRLAEHRDAQLRQQAEQLQRTNRLASVGEMATTLAHELNQPLMALNNYASAARSFADQGNTGMLQQSLSEITSQAQRSAEIVRRIRGFVRPRTAGMEPCSLNEVATNVSTLMTPEIRRHDCQLQLLLSADLPLIQGDRILLEQVVLNLIMNSMQAMMETPVSQRLISVLTRVDAHQVLLAVQDRGPGLSDEVSQQLFNPFYTTKPEGLGLGLNICKTIIEAHRAQLTHHNLPEGGVRFDIRFDLLSPAA